MDLREFRARALGGDPSDRALAGTAGVSPTTIGNWLGRDQFPQDIGAFLSVVRAIAARATARGVAATGHDSVRLLAEERWRAAYQRREGSH